MLDFIRIACAVPDVKVGNVKENARDICGYLAQAEEKKADIVLFPELALTGYSCGDLFFQDALWNAVKVGVGEIGKCSAAHPEVTVVFGLPVRAGGRLYNCAAVMQRGEVLGLVPKTHLTTAERRWFAPAESAPGLYLEPGDIGLAASQDYWDVPMGAKQLFRLGNEAVFGVELCQDAMVPQPCCGDLAVNGAEVVLNLSASAQTVGKRAYRRELITHLSASCCCIYAYASAGWGESTSDMVYSGHSMIAENGTLLEENKNAIDTGYMILQDCDLGRVRADRAKEADFHAASEGYRETAIPGSGLRGDGTCCRIQKLPFIPDNQADRYARCMEIFSMQVTGLKRRLSAIRANAVIGISGGLDSTLALLVAVEAMRQLGRPATDVYGVTMPCFGTSDRTYQNSWELMRTLGVNAKEINIRKAVSQHFEDIGHDPSVHNATFENSQARERTQILMDYAGSVGGIVVGTGDLSELALGWCTYNGDHMSMYGVNASVPKTLIRWIIEAVCQDEAFAPARAVLMDVLDTPISPELLPPDAQGKIAQQTEELVGPYALHDFFLYYMLRWGFAPKKIYTLACRAFEGDFDRATIKKWLVNFYRRFFTQQFKRNCMPDGVKVGSVGLGPRGDWCMPSDACANLWLEEAENL